MRHDLSFADMNAFPALVTRPLGFDRNQYSDGANLAVGNNFLAVNLSRAMAVNPALIRNSTVIIPRP